MPTEKRDDDARFHETRRIAARIVQDETRRRVASAVRPGAVASPPPPHAARGLRFLRLRQRLEELRVILRVRSESVLRFLPPLLAVASALIVLWKFLLAVGDAGRVAIFAGEEAILLLFAARILVILLLAGHPLATVRRAPLAHLLALFAIAVFARHAAVGGISLDRDPLFFAAATAVKAYLIAIEANELWIAGVARLRLSPSLTLVLTFVTLIGAGTGLLLDDRATTPEKRITPIDALFTATSAACVTGLTVRDTGTEFTRFGQNVILALIQIGGLGIMTYTAFVAALFGRGLSIRDKVLMREMLQTEALDRLPAVLGLIVAVTLGVEAAGALLLYILDESVSPGGERLYHAAFHAVSAFCNAGFGLYPDNLGRFERRPDVLAVFAALIVVGGLGYVVVIDVVRKAPRAIAAALTAPLRRLRGRRSASPLRPLSLQSRVVLLASAALVIAGAGLFLLYDARDGAVFDKLSPEDKVANALFLSVSCRTAGFNIAPVGTFTAGSLLVMMLLMFVGGSPGSTAGGVKTTTFAVLVARVAGLLRRREEVEMGGRTIPRRIIANAIGVVFVQSALIALVALGVLYTDPKIPLERSFFEVVSAFGTVGLSTGVTADLSPAGRVLITIGMFAGRVGPVTLLLAMAEQQGAAPSYRYPDGKVMIG